MEIVFSRVLGRKFWLNFKTFLIGIIPKLFEDNEFNWENSEQCIEMLHFPSIFMQIFGKFNES